MSRYDALVDQLRANLARIPDERRLIALRDALGQLEESVLAVDDTGHYVGFSPRALAMTGYDADELLQMSVIELTPIPSTADGRELWAAFMRTGRQRGTYELRYKGGNPVAVRYWAYAGVIPGVHLSFLEDDSAASQGHIRGVA